jgi:hypothetical protein
MAGFLALNHPTFCSFPSYAKNSCSLKLCYKVLFIKAFKARTSETVKHKLSGSNADFVIITVTGAAKVFHLFPFYLLVYINRSTYKNLLNCHLNYSIRLLHSQDFNFCFSLPFFECCFMRYDTILSIT